MSFISIGNCNKYYIYLLIAFICEFFMKLLFGLNASNREHPARIFSFKPKLKEHNLLQNFIRFVSIFLGGIILYLLEKKNKSKIDNVISIETYDKMQYDILKKKDNKFLHVVLIGVIFSLYVILKEFLELAGIHVGFWTLEIMYICIISYFISKFFGYL